MSDWDDFFQAQHDHDACHLQYAYLSPHTIQQHFPDLSCPICFPDQHSFDPEWLRFRQWFSAMYHVRFYTENTRRYWDQLAFNPQPLGDNSYIQITWRLIQTVRYNQLPPPVVQVLQVIRDEFWLTQRFTLDPRDLNDYYGNAQTVPDSLPSSTASEVSSNPSDQIPLS